MKPTENVLKENQILHLGDKTFESAIMNIFK